MKELIESGKAVLGIEFGSTRIKAVLIDTDNRPIAQGNHEWENRFENGLWTYSLEDIWSGLQSCYRELRKDVRERYGAEIHRLAAIGISGMMHGFMPFDSEGNLLTPFRTWRNTNTGEAAAILSRLLNFNIPLRWSISHLYQAILDKEPYVEKIDFITTLAGYVHRKLTGEKVVGLDEGSGIFPVDPSTCSYDSAMLDKMQTLLKDSGCPLQIRSLLPKTLAAGAHAGNLTPEGALLLDPEGKLQAGIPFCPPEGDAGTGMVATDAVRPGTGNVSAGTSSFSMIVLDKNLSRPYDIIDIVTTPDGKPVAMVHCNNCTSDLNAWIGIFKESLALFGLNPDASELFGKLYNIAMEGDPDCGGLTGYNFVSGEPIADVAEGKPLVFRKAADRFSLANFMRMHLYSAMACLKIGNHVLFNEEGIKIERLMAHGGFFKTPGVGQRVLAAALVCPVSVMETAGEGGAWGMALLAGYMANNPEGLTLPDYLDRKVFAGSSSQTIEPDAADRAGFEIFMNRYITSLPLERQ